MSEHSSDSGRQDHVVYANEAFRVGEDGIELEPIDHRQVDGSQLYQQTDMTITKDITAPPNGEFPHEEVEPPPEIYEGTGCSKKVGDGVILARRWLADHQQPITASIAVVSILFFCGYFIYACWYDFDNVTEMLVFTILTLLYMFYAIVRDRWGDQIDDACIVPCCGVLKKYWYIYKWPLYLLMIVGLIVFILFEAKDYPPQLMSAVGAVVFISFAFVFSKYPGAVQWRPVLWGLGLQFIFAVFILRTRVGFELFKWLGDFVQVFLSFSDYGAAFVFGEGFEEHYFAFAVMPVVIYFACFIAICYYLGIMQWVIIKIAWLFEVTMETSPCESLNAAGNIFIGQTEAPLLIKPFLKDMTKSELHAVMVGGFATIAGSVMGAYIAFGVSASHLISASVISAPAALGISKLFYPETRFDKTLNKEGVIDRIGKPEERNFLEAAANGACQAVPLVANIIANLIAFVALLELFNFFLWWVGDMVGIENLSFESICSYLFAPVSFLIGIEPEDCRIVAGLIGTKLFLNEFVAYEKLGELIENRENGVEPSISYRSEVITTYVLCGFDNISSIGIQLGGLTPMAPSRKSDLAEVALRALIAGTLTCFMTACVAGMLYTEFD